MEYRALRVLAWSPARSVSRSYGDGSQATSDCRRGHASLTTITAMRRLVAVAVLVSCLGACGGSAVTTSQQPKPVKNLSAVRLLPCSETIGAQAPFTGLSVILRVVALPTSPHMRRALQTALTGSRNPAARLFAKEGLVVRAGARFEVSVPPRLRDRVSIGWGNAGEGHVGSTISVPGCRGAHGEKWLAFAGGYWVRSTICAPLIVDAHGLRRRVWIGIGEACPGQFPPPQPTQT